MFQARHRARPSGRLSYSLAACLATLASASAAQAVSSAELYTQAHYAYGRFEARISFAAGDGVVSSFFLWKNGSEMADIFWNELDIEKLRECDLETNALYGLPEMSHNQEHAVEDLCGGFHTYAYEWTPEYIAWSIDGVEIRRDTGESARAFAENAAQGMQIRFNIWPGDITFGGNFDPAILPVHQYINWVQYSSYQQGGAFQVEWREDFDSGQLPAGWLAASWNSPKNLSTHTQSNLAFVDGYAVLSLTADDAVGFSGEPKRDDGGPAPEPSGTAGAGGAPGQVEPEPSTGGTSTGPNGAGGFPAPDPADPEPGPLPTGPTGPSAPTEPTDPNSGGTAGAPPAEPSASTPLPSPSPVPTTAPSTPATNPTSSGVDAPPTPSSEGPARDSESGGCSVVATPQGNHTPWFALAIGLFIARARCKSGRRTRRSRAG